MSAPERDPVEDLLAAVLERPEPDWERALADACVRQPALANALRERFHRLVDSGLDGVPAAASIPDRLGRYELIERIGGGGMGVVYRARDRELGRDVALKLVRPELLYFPGARERFRREVGASAALQHEGIVAVHEFGESDGIPFFAMELVTGQSLAEVVERLRDREPSTLTGADLAKLLEPLGEPAPHLARWSWCELCAAVVGQAARAVDHAHARGVVHRDLKPGNLMLTPEGRVRVLDFGVSLREGVSRLTRSGAMVGSPLYAAPEQLRSGAGDRRVDVYGLGVTLYELLTLRAPFLARDPERSRQRILAGRFEPIARRQRAVPRDLETVCLKAMDLDAERRYPTARALAEDLEQVLEQHPVAARRASVALRARRLARRHPTLAAVVVLGALLALAAPVVLWLQSRAYVEDLERLSDELVVDELLAEDERLWPAVPENAPAMARWIERASEVIARGSIHEDTLGGLRASALPRGAAEVAEDERRLAALRARHDRATKKVEELRAAGRIGSRELAWAEQNARELALDLGVRAAWQTWRFADVAASWRHTRLVALLDKLRRLPERRARLRERHELAVHLRARTIDAHRDAWAQAIAAVASSARYGSMALTPQRGLIPLGLDQDSGLLELAHLPSGEPAIRDAATGRLRIEVETGIVLVLIPAGSFVMGAAPPADPLAQPVEAPPHEVAIDAFLLAKHEMTQAQWLRATGENPAEVAPPRARTVETVTLLHPIENVTWLECERTLQRLDLALPTEAQWERAVRAGTTTPWWTGADVARLEGAVNLRDRTVRKLYSGLEGTYAPFHDGFVAHAPIGSFQPNGFGLHDGIGNISEWVQDTFDAANPLVGSYQEPGRRGDGLRLDPLQTNAVYRGGSYLDSPAFARVTSRKKEERANRSQLVGVRPARSVAR